jgi:hypothetical protein
VITTSIADAISGSEKRHIPDAGAKNRRKIACGGQSSPYRTHASCADITSAQQDKPGGLKLNDQGPERHFLLTDSVTAS